MKYNVKQINNINVIKTRKYKDVNLYLRFSIEYSEIRKALFGILAKLIGEKSKEYNTKVKMSKAKDMLYGINCQAGFKGRANILSFNVRYSFINPKFVNDVCIDDYIEFIKETFFNVLIDDETVKEAKKTCIAALQRRLDKPSSIAYESVCRAISKDNPYFKINSMGKDYLNNLDKVCTNDVVKMFEYIINSNEITVYLCGDVNKKVVKKFNIFNKETEYKTFVKYPKLVYKKHNKIIEHGDFSQSYLSVVYQTPFTKKHKDFYAFVLGNIFLGVLPNSLLFEEVREKLSLCYSISVIDYKNDGLVRIYTEIDSKNADLVIKKIQENIQRLIDKNYDIEKMEMSKTLFANIIESTYDDQGGFIDYLYESKLSRFDVSLEEYIDNLNKVTVDDLSRVFKQYKFYFSYLLVGDKYA